MSRTHRIAAEKNGTSSAHRRFSPSAASRWSGIVGRPVSTPTPTCVALRYCRNVSRHLTDLDLHRHGHLDLLGRAWKLRDNITAYDAMYVVLAEAIEAPLVTCDRPLAKASGHRARIEVID